jgi:GNAT superfamily N-acetyltransferase
VSAPETLCIDWLPMRAPGALDRFAAINRETEYAGGVTPSHLILVAQDAGRLVGALRIVREHAVLVLRGMRVRASFQGRGVGTRLLEHISALEGPCWCIPHAHLDSFYARAGFVRIADEGAPGFLRRRVHAYRLRGLRAVLMKRR